MSLGKITKQELSTELYNDLKQEELQLNTTPADVEISGRTLVNLLGRYGNAIYKQFDSNHSYGTVGYENDAYTLTNTAENSWITTLNTSHNFEKGKYYISVSEIYHVSGNYSYISLNCKADGIYKDVHFTTNEVNKWVTCWHSCKCGDPLDGHPKPYLALASNGATPSTKFRNTRVYEITEEEYNALDGLTREQVGQKYPYVDDIKCVVNPYVECKENLLASSKVTPQYSYNTNNGSQMLGAENARATFLGKHYIKPNTKYILSSDVAINIPNLEMRASIFNGANPMIWDTAWGVPFTKEMIIEPVANAEYIHFAFRKANDALFTEEEYELLTDATFTLVKGSTPKSYDECHNSRMMFETKLYDGEKITRDNSGKYIKNSEWGELEFSPSGYIPRYAQKYTGFKGFTIPKEVVGNVMLTAHTTDEPHQIVSYNGSYYVHNSSFSSSNGVPTMNFDSVFDGTSGSVWREISFTLPNNLTGWGDNYTPTDEEIRAFFLGWSMADNTGAVYNGTGTKLWQKLYCGVGTAGLWSARGVYVVANEYTSTCPTEMNDRGYTPYRFIYKKATPTIEEIKTHGSLVVKDGVDVRVNSGLVLGAIVEPFFANDQNYVGGASTKSNVSHRLSEVLKVFDVDGNVLTHVNIGRATAEGCIKGGNNQATYTTITNNDLADYLIYTADTVTSFPVVIDSPQTTKEILEKTVEELSNINEKLSAENRDLKNKIESLPQVSNPNLLINGDFQVWQRGTSFSTGSIRYTADRWMSHKVGCEKVADGIKITGDGVLEYHIENLDRLIGKPLTLSYSMNGVIYTQTKTLTKNPTYTTQILSFRSDSWTDSGRFTVNNLVAPYTLNWVKIEIGDKATPHVPRHYAEELAMCQRYYEKLKSVVQVSPKLTVDGKYYCSSFSMIEKRITPTVTPTNDGNFINVCIIPKANISISTYETNSKMIQPLVALPTSVAYTDSVCILWFDADAEIY